MRIEEIWWKRLTNPSNFAENIIYSVSILTYKNREFFKFLKYES